MKILIIAMLTITTCGYATCSTDSECEAMYKCISEHEGETTIKQAVKDCGEELELSKEWLVGFNAGINYEL